VWRTARRLDAALAGRALTIADLRWPSLATVDLTGRTVVESTSAGKHLLLRLAADGDRPALTLHSHLKMEGSWRVQHAAGPAARGSGVRAVLGNPGWTAVGYRLGALDLVPTRDEARLVAHLGPDLLGPGWDAAEAVRRLGADPARPVGDALLDQRLLAGAGTFFMAEALFVRGITPWTPVGSVSGLEELVNLLHRMLSASAGGPGQTTTGDTRPGHRQWVHGRAGRPCRRCGTSVLVAPIGAPPRDRVAFYCPACQRGTTPAVGGRA
jgi:endonuclease-8